MGKWPYHNKHRKTEISKSALEYLVNDGMQDEKFLSQDTEIILVQLFLRTM
jgi:hypothetical protein